MASVAVAQFLVVRRRRRSLRFETVFWLAVVFASRFLRWSLSDISEFALEIRDLICELTGAKLALYFGRRFRFGFLAGAFEFDHAAA